MIILLLRNDFGSEDFHLYPKQTLRILEIDFSAFLNISAPPQVEI
jgi:hypothetical protein